MWTLPLFTNLFRLLDPNRPCALPTYSRSTILRVTLLLAGFFVGVGHATGEKEETTFAANCLDLVEEPLDHRWLERAHRSSSAEPLTEPVYRQAKLSAANWERLQQHPQFDSRRGENRKRIRELWRRHADRGSRAECRPRLSKTRSTLLTFDPRDAPANALRTRPKIALFAPGFGNGKLRSFDVTTDLNSTLANPAPILALAPMQDVTDLAFWRLISTYGGADLYFTEYFRVYATSNLDRNILKSITENPTGKPVIAQMIGNDIPSLVRTARELQQYPIAAVDLNLGCPAPVVYRKCAGGGLLRNPADVDAILGALRDAIKIRFTVKTRIGFDSPALFSELLAIFAKHSIDLLTVHGRTVKEMYRSEVHYDFIAQAVETVPCPVLANGNVYSARKAAEVLQTTGARGLMIGRGAIRNPWLFHQIRQYQAGQQLYVPKGCDVLAYVRALIRDRLLSNGSGRGPGSEDEKIHELPRRGRRADRRIPAPNPPRHQSLGFFCDLRSIFGSRPAHAAGAISVGPAPGRHYGRGAPIGCQPYRYGRSIGKAFGKWRTSRTALFSRRTSTMSKRTLTPGFFSRRR